MNKIDLNKYQDFVEEVTSDESNNSDEMARAIMRLTVQSPNDVNVSLLLTGAVGMSAEGGEFMEIVKKCIFQGKPLDEDAQFHAKRELGDIMWYWINSCRALNLDPNEVIAENVRKLEKRYPGGSFDAYYSENRQDGDL
ncbi:MAG: pyrophosphatase [Legionellales bacterium]|nr:pyrophosphatase [Legionellales bacterium]|tara:strand:+ start:401 stop:817 length:417 start_codon:yes stop_codon:yes gene_type:complete